MDNTSNDQKKDARETFKDQKWVTRLIHVPEVVWFENVVKILQIFGIKVPRNDFDVYWYIDIQPFVYNAKNAFRTALIGHALAYVGIKLSFSTEPGKENIPTVSIDPNKSETAMETIRALVRNERAAEKYRSTLENASPDQKEFVRNLSDKNPEFRGNSIVDVNKRNNL